MVEKIRSPKTKWPLPKIRIESKKLVEIIAECVGKNEEISAKNGAYRFAGIQDLRDNAELLAGNPEIKIGETTINLDNGLFHGVEHPSYKADMGLERSEMIADKLNELLKDYTTYIRRFSFRWTASLVLALPVSIFLVGKDAVWWELSFASMFFYQAFVWVLGKLLDESPVFYAPRETFWDRNKDTVIVGSIMAFVGAIIAWGLQNYLGN